MSTLEPQKIPVVEQPPATNCNEIGGDSRDIFDWLASARPSEPLPYDYHPIPGVPKRIWTRLGDLISTREHDAVMKADREDYVVLRLDIRSMKGFRNGMGLKTYSEAIGECMRLTTLRLMAEFNAMFALTQSDEITLLLSRKESTSANKRDNGLFSGTRDKLISLAAAIASCTFNRLFYQHVLLKPLQDDCTMAYFDCRMSTWSTEREAMHVIAWRQEDCARNGISDAAIQHNPKWSVHNGGEKLAMLHSVGKLPLPAHQAYGTFYAVEYKVRGTVNLYTGKPSTKAHRSFVDRPEGSLTYMQEYLRNQEAARAEAAAVQSAASSSSSSSAVAPEPTNHAVECNSGLVTVGLIKYIDAIAGAERIELATIRGWQVVVTKSDGFKVGDLAIYFTDNTFPDATEGCPTAFLKGAPLLIKKMLGEKSQGLVGPLSWAAYYDIDPATLREDDDLTAKMRCRKVVSSDEIAQYKQHDVHKPFPDGVPVTELHHIQDTMRMIHRSRQNGIRLVGRLKYDGQSGTSVVVAADDFAVCGRNWRWADRNSETEIYYRMAEKYMIREKLSDAPHIALQYEIIGPGINGNKHRLTDWEIRVFKAWNRESKRYLGCTDLEYLCRDLELPIAIKVFDDVAPEEWTDSRVIVKYACNLKDEWGNPAEGMVLVTDGGDEEVYMQARVLSSDYLLANGRIKKKQK